MITLPLIITDHSILNLKLHVFLASHWIKHDSQGKEYVGVFSFTANPTDKGDHAILDLFTDRIRLYVDTGASTLKAAKSLINFMGGKKTEVS